MEIVTAHAKPVARKLDRSIVKTPPQRQRKKSHRFSRPTETLGLAALFVFGIGLILVGGSMLFGGSDDAIDILGAAALATPGLAAVFVAGFGLWRGPIPKAA